MDIVSQTPTCLVAQARPGKRPAFLAVGVLVIAGGVLILLMTGSVVTLTCRRTSPMEGKIELVSSRLIGSETRDAPLESVRSVVIKHGISRGGGGVVLLTNTGEFSLASLSSGRADELAGRLTAFLSVPGSPDLTIRQDNRPATFGVGLAMIAVGALILMLGFEKVVCNFDKSGKRIAIVRTGLFGTRKAEYEMGQVADFRAEWTSKRRKGMVVYLMLKSGDRVHAGWPDDRDTVGAIRRFLGLNGGN